MSLWIIKLNVYCQQYTGLLGSVELSLEFGPPNFTTYNKWTLHGSVKENDYGLALPPIFC